MAGALAGAMSEGDWVEGPLHAQILSRGDRGVLLLGELHSRSRCPRRGARSLAALLASLVRRLPRREAVDLFVEQEEEEEDEAGAGAGGPRGGAGPSALEKLRALAARLRRGAAPRLRVRYTDPRTRLCMPQHRELTAVLEPVLAGRRRSPALGAAAIRIVDLFARRPAARLLRHPRGAFRRARAGLDTADRDAVARRLEPLRGQLDAIDRDLRRDHTSDDAVWEALFQYNQLSNRLSDTYTACRLLHPAVRVAVVYVGYNHAMRLGEHLRGAGFAVFREYGKTVKSVEEAATVPGAGCLPTAHTGK